MIAKYDQMLNNRQHFVCVDPYVNSDNIILNNISCHFWGYNRFYLQYCCYVLLSMGGGSRIFYCLLFLFYLQTLSPRSPLTLNTAKTRERSAKICAKWAASARHAPTNVRITNTQKPPVHCTVAGRRVTVVTIFTIFTIFSIFSWGYLLGGD